MYLSRFSKSDREPGWKNVITVGFSGPVVIPIWVLLWNAMEDYANPHRLLTFPSIAGCSKLNALTTL